MTAEQERAAVVAYLERQMHDSWAMAESLPWWQFRLRFGNKVASASCGRLMKRIRWGDHHK